MHRITGSGSDRGSVENTSSAVSEGKEKDLEVNNHNDSIKINVDSINNNYNKLYEFESNDIRNKSKMSDSNDLNDNKKLIAKETNTDNDVVVNKKNTNKCLDCIAVAPEGEYILPIFFS